ncbi:hypothetical protein [Lysinibacillus sp. NPDC047702]|uniref:hypothetical protein n=1 Tax=unclassified Lysinibacillus TaxID=2636778 RepID=UPI003CFCC0D0
MSQFIIKDEWFLDEVIRKYQAYAIVDIENKINRLLRTETRDEFFDERISKLMDERNYYERASKVQLLGDLIESAKERLDEEEMSYAKAAFDLVLSKRKFNSYH